MSALEERQAAVWFEEMQQRVRTLQRPWRLFARIGARALPPTWMPRNDVLRKVYVEQDRLLRAGSLVWAWLVQANNLLFAPGPDDHPALIVLPTDITNAAPIARLSAVAQRVYQLKNTTPADAGERELARLVSDEMRRSLGWRVPATVAGPTALTLTACMVFRRALPEGRLHRGLLPMLTHPQTDVVLPVPLRCWPEAFERWWRRPA